MLLVGVWRHGLGNWEAIREDPDLGFGDKFFLEDAKKAKDAAKAEGEAKTPKVIRTPGAIHLVRRAEYLLKTLLDLSTKHERRDRSPANADSPGGSQVPKKKSSKPKMHKSKDSPQPTPSTSKHASDHANGSSKGKKPAAAPKEDDGYASMDDDACKALMRPVKKELKELKNGTDHLEREAKIASLKRCLNAISRRIDEIITGQAAPEKEKLRRHCWQFTSYFW